jgi:hypothetical protein
VPNVMKFWECKAPENLCATLGLLQDPLPLPLPLHKIIFISNLAQYIVISKYVKIWNRNFMFVRPRVVKFSPYHSKRIKRNKTEYILKHVRNLRFSHTKRVNGNQLGISNVLYQKSLM